MPYVIRREDGQWCVHMQEPDGSAGGRVPGGCHDTEDDAKAHMRALYRNVEGAAEPGCSCQDRPAYRVVRELPPTILDRVDDIRARVATAALYREARRAATTGPFDAPFPTPEYPPGDWFDGPPGWVAGYRAEQGLGSDVETGPDGEPVHKLTVTDDGRVGGWFYEHGQCLVHRPDACPGPSPTGYAAFHQNDVVTADGSLAVVGVIGNTHGHASPWASWRDAQRHYADPSAQMIVCRAGDDDRGGWIAGAVVPGLTYGDVAMLRRCSLSGDWRPDFSRQWFEQNGATAAAVARADGYDCVGPTLVTRPGLPLTAGRSRGVVVVAASVGPPASALAAAVDDTVASDTPDRVLPDGWEIEEDGMARTRVKLPDGTTIESLADEPRMAAVIGAADLPLAERDATWDATAADGRVRKLASSDSSGNPETIDWASYSRAFFYRDDGADPKSFGAYKLGFADVVNGQLQAVPKGIFAVAGVLQGARGGADIPTDAQDQIKGKVASYYASMRTKFGDDTITVPWAAAAGDAPIEAQAPGDTTTPEGDRTTPPVEAPEDESIPPTVEELAKDVEDLEERLAAVEEFLSAMLEDQMAAALAEDVELPEVEGSST